MDLDEIFRTSPTPGKSFLGGGLRSGGLQGYGPEPKRPASRKTISCLSFCPTSTWQTFGNLRTRTRKKL